MTPIGVLNQCQSFLNPPHTGREHAGNDSNGWAASAGGHRSKTIVRLLCEMLSSTVVFGLHVRMYGSGSNVAVLDSEST